MTLGRYFLKSTYRSLQYRYLKTKFKWRNGTLYTNINEVKIISEFHEKINQRDIKIYPLSKGSINIFFAGTDYSQDFSGFIQNLKKYGNVTTLINEKKNYGVLLPRFLLDRQVIASNSRALVKQVKEVHQKKRIDVFLCQLLSNYVSTDALREIQKLGIPVINISLDDLWLKNWERYHGYQLGAIGLGGGVDLFLTSTKEVISWYYKNDCLAIYQPMASDPDIFHPREPKIFDVSFVGARYGLRNKIVASLIKQGINIATFGSGWANGAIEFNKMAEVFGRSKIILGIGYAGYNRDITTLKNRDFDALMSGALYITSKNNQLSELFTEDKEIVFYKTITECKEKIDFYLNNSKKLSEIARAGYYKAISYHTWEIRLGELFKKLGFLL